jgi:hypothetical protein
LYQTAASIHSHSLSSFNGTYRSIRLVNNKNCFIHASFHGEARYKADPSAHQSLAHSFSTLVSTHNAPDRSLYFWTSSISKASEGFFKTSRPLQFEDPATALPTRHATHDNSKTAKSKRAKARSDYSRSRPPLYSSSSTFLLLILILQARNLDLSDRSDEVCATAVIIRLWEPSQKSFPWYRKQRVTFILPMLILWSVLHFLISFMTDYLHDIDRTQILPG